MKKVFFAIAACFVLLTACTGNTNITARRTPTPIIYKSPVLTPSIEPFPSVTGVVPQWGMRTQVADCVPHMEFPDKSCTPGDIFKNATTQHICVPGYTKTVRNVSTQDRMNIEDAYNVTHQSRLAEEIDHFVPLELGGSNDYSNLWPQFAPQFRQKDQAENYLHGEVCKGKISLEQAQVAIADDWAQVYLMMPKACQQPYPAIGCAYTTDSADDGQ